MFASRYGSRPLLNGLRASALLATASPTARLLVLAGIQLPRSNTSRTLPNRSRSCCATVAMFARICKEYGLFSNRCPANSTSRQLRSRCSTRQESSPCRIRQRSFRAPPTRAFLHGSKRLGHRSPLHFGSGTPPTSGLDRLFRGDVGDCGRQMTADPLRKRGCHLRWLHLSALRSLAGQ